MKRIGLLLAALVLLLCLLGCDAYGLLYREEGQKDSNLGALLDMIDQRNPDGVDAYLKHNYTRNIECFVQKVVTKGLTLRSEPCPK